MQNLHNELGMKNISAKNPHTQEKGKCDFILNQELNPEPPILESGFHCLK